MSFVYKMNCLSVATSILFYKIQNTTGIIHIRVESKTEKMA